MVNDKNNYKDSLNVTLSKAELKVLNLILKYNDSINVTLSIKFFQHCTGYSTSHIKRCIKNLWKNHIYIEVQEQKDIRGRSLANKFHVTNQGYLFLSQNETPTIIKELIKFSQKNSFDIFHLKKYYLNEIIKNLQTYSTENLSILNIVESFFNKDIQGHTDKLFTKENWIRRAISYAKIAKQISLSQIQIPITSLDENQLIDDKDIEKLKEKGLSEEEIEKGKKAFKEKNKGNYIQDKTITRTFAQWRIMLLVWLRNRIRHIKTKISVSVQEYMFSNHNITKEVDKQLGEKLSISNNLFIKYHNGKKYAKEIWDRLSVGWKQNALKNMRVKKEKEIKVFLEQKEKEVSALLSNVKDNVRLAYQNMLQNNNEELSIAARILLTKRCYTKEDRLQKDISEEILKVMYQNQKYDLETLNILNNIEIIIPSEEVIAIKSKEPSYYDMIEQKNKKLLCGEMIRCKIDEKYGISVIVDRDRGEELWRK